MSAVSHTLFDTMIVGAKVATCDGAGSGYDALAVREVAIGIRDGLVHHLGDPEPARETVDAHGCCVLPGLVDPHTHLVFAGTRVDEMARRMSGVDYRTIAAEGGGIMSTVRATRAASDDALFEGAAARARALRSGGVTSLEAKSGYGLTVRDELRILRAARRVADEGIVKVTTSFLGAHAVPPDIGREAYVDQVVLEQLPAVVAEGLADACDVYCDEGAFTLEETRRVLSAARAAGLRCRAHIGQFADLGGAELCAEVGATSADHLEEVSDAGLRAMAEAGIVAVLLPGAWRTLRQTPPSAARLRDAGVRMAVGTDLNPGTSATSDLLMCAALAVRDAGMTLEEALLAVTREAAAAAGVTGGTIALGAPADLALYRTADPRALVYALGGIRARSVYLQGVRVHHDLSAPGIW